LIPSGGQHYFTYNIADYINFRVHICSYYVSYNFYICSKVVYCFITQIVESKIKYYETLL